MFSLAYLSPVVTFFGFFFSFVRLHEYCWHLMHTIITGELWEETCTIRIQLSPSCQSNLLIALSPREGTPRFFLPVWFNPHKTRDTPGNCTLELHCYSSAFSLDGINFTSHFQKLCQELLVSQINYWIVTSDNCLM
jgi:hypothetical protein